MFSKYFGNRLLMDAAGKEGGGGGGGDGKPDAAKELADMKSANAALMSRLEALEKAGKGGGDGKDEKDLKEKSELERQQKDKNAIDQKQLQSAIEFDVKSADWLKQHSSLLPSDVADVFETVKKEKYDSPVKKDAELKSAIIQSFFKIQANIDLLTSGPKNQVEDYLKLTKDGKAEKAQQMFEQVFEPAFAMLKAVKKAEALGKGHNPGDNDAYKNKLIQGSQKHYGVGVNK